MQTDINEWVKHLEVISKVSDHKYVLIVNDGDFWPMTAALILNPQVRVQASAFVTYGTAYLVPDPEEKNG